MEPCLTPALLGRIASDLQGLRRLNAFEVAGDHTISLLDLLEVGVVLHWCCCHDGIRLHLSS